MQKIGVGIGRTNLRACTISLVYRVKSSKINLLNRVANQMRQCQLQVIGCNLVKRLSVHNNFLEQIIEFY